MIEGSMYLSWKTGLDEEYGTLELAINLGVIERRGSVYDLYDGTSLGYAKAFRKKKELWDEKFILKLNDAYLKHGVIQPMIFQRKKLKKN